MDQHTSHYQPIDPRIENGLGAPSIQKQLQVYNNPSNEKQHALLI